MAGGPGRVGSSNGLAAWRAWTPGRAAAHFADCATPWWLAGGWALEAHAGCTTAPRRQHSDLDLAVLRPDLPAIRKHLPGWDLQVAHDGRLTPLGETLAPDRHALWCRPSVDDGWAFELLISGIDDHGYWVFRRDSRIRLPKAEIGHVDHQGIPFLLPEIVLLFKAARIRSVDEQDLATTLPLLRDDQRRWLDESIRLVHPTQAWLAHTR